MNTFGSLSLLLLSLLLLSGSAQAHPGDGDSTIVVDVTVTDDGSWRAELHFDGRDVVGRVRSWYPQPPDFIRAALVPDWSASQQRDALLRAYAPYLRVTANGKPLPYTVISVGEDPRLADTAQLPDHRWGRLVVGGRLPASSSDIGFAVWPPLQPFALTVTLPGPITINEFVNDSSDGSSAAVSLIEAPNLNLGNNQGWRQAATITWRYGHSGWRHVLPAGLDHLLFVLALALVTPSLWRLIGLLSLFTVAHSGSVTAVALGVVSPPAQIVEPLIALSIAAVAWWHRPARQRAIARSAARHASSGPKAQTLISGLAIVGFGLVHGLGFGGALAVRGLPSEAPWLALLGFNLGVEAAQALVVICWWAVTTLLRSPRMTACGFSPWGHATLLGLLGAVALTTAASLTETSSDTVSQTTTGLLIMSAGLGCTAFSLGRSLGRSLERVNSPEHEATAQKPQSSIDPIQPEHHALVTPGCWIIVIAATALAIQRMFGQ